MLSSLNAIFPKCYLWEVLSFRSVIFDKHIYELINKLIFNKILLIFYLISHYFPFLEEVVSPILSHAARCHFPSKWMKELKFLPNIEQNLRNTWKLKQSNI
jgi:hypothetical protein